MVWFTLIVLTLLVELGPSEGFYLLKQTTIDAMANIKIMPPQIAKTAMRPLFMSGSLEPSVLKKEPVCWTSVVVYGTTGVTGVGLGVSTEHAGS